MAIVKSFSRNKAFFNAFRKDVEDSMKAIETKYGIKVTPGSISYSEVEFTMKLKATIDSPEAVAVKGDKEKENWDFICRYAANTFAVGLKPEWFGKSFTAQGKTLKIVGYNTRAKKSPVKLEDTNGKGYKAPVDMVVRHIGAAV